MGDPLISLISPISPPGMQDSGVSNLSREKPSAKLDVGGSQHTLTIVQGDTKPLPKVREGKFPEEIVKFMPQKGEVSVRKLALLQAGKIDVAIEVLKSHDEAEEIRLSSGATVIKWKKYDKDIKTLEALRDSVLQTAAFKKDTAATKAAVSSEAHLEEDLKRLLMEHMKLSWQELNVEWTESAARVVSPEESVVTKLTNKELAEAQYNKIQDALVILPKVEKDTSLEMAKSLNEARRILMQLSSFVHPNTIDKPQDAASETSLAAAKNLEQELIQLLEKVGVEDAKFYLIETRHGPLQTLPTQQLSNEERSEERTLSNKALAEFQAKQIDAAMMLLLEDNNMQEISVSGNNLFGGFKLGKHDTAIRTLEHLKRSILQTVAHKGEERATLAQQKAAKQVEKDLVALLASNLHQPNKVLREKLREKLTEALNEQPWEPIRTEFTHNGKTYKSEHIPAGKLDIIVDGHHLATEYKGHGFSSGSSTEADHAINLWASNFAIDGEVKFKGVRHGILSPYGLESGSGERKQGAINRAKEVVAAAISLDPSKLNDLSDGDEYTLKLASSSLVTPFDTAGIAGSLMGRAWGHTEGSQLKDQVEAWQAISDGRSILMTVPDGKGVLKTVRVKVEVAPFNFGVNEGALTIGGISRMSWGPSDTYNAAAFEQLLGSLDKNAEIGGWVGAFLKDRPEDDAQAILAKKLVAQIREIWENKSHRSDGGEPYKLAVRVVVLANAIGVVPAWNCKSGKDRTGVLDTEAKMLLAQLEQTDQTSPAPRELGATFSSDDQALYRGMLAHTGSLEIQQYNTGLEGNKVLEERHALIKLSIAKERIGDEEFGALMSGFSILAKT